MSHLVLITLPDGRWLGLTPEELAAALDKGRKAMPGTHSEVSPGAPSDTQWLTAEQMAGRTGVKASWFLTSARLNEIPHVRLGKYVRFDPNVVMPILGRPTDTRTTNTRMPPKPLNGIAL